MLNIIFVQSSYFTLNVHFLFSKRLEYQFPLDLLTILCPDEAITWKKSLCFPNRPATRLLKVYGLNFFETKF